MNMRKWLISLSVAIVVATTGCVPESSNDPYDNDAYGAGYTEVNEPTWSSLYSSVYPFTVASGEIVCSQHPRFGRMVYFMPAGFIDESYIGTPLNQAAANFLDQESISANVPYTLKKYRINRSYKIGSKNL